MHPKKYDEDFKKSIVTLFVNGKTQSELSKEYGVSLSAIKDGFAFTPKSIPMTASFLSPSRLKTFKKVSCNSKRRISY